MKRTLFMLDAGASPTSGIGAEHWHQLIATVFGAVDMRLGDESRFVGSMRHASLGSIELADVASSCEDSTRTSRHVAHDKRESFVMVMPLEGRLSLSQKHNACEVGPGEFALFNLNAPHHYLHDGHLRALSLKAPCDMLRARAGRIDDLLATAFPAGKGVARITFDLVASLLRERSAMPEHVVGLCGERLADMTALMLDCSRSDLPAGNPSVRGTIYQRCLRLIDAQLADPELNAERIAGECGISTRYLHKIFQSSEETLGECIRNRRLTVCRDRLMVQKGALQVKEVALSAGFRSASHFCHAFKARFGMAPRDVRQVRDLH